MSVLNTIAVVAAAVVAYVAYTSTRNRRKLPYPPGPPGLPLLGHLKFPEYPLWEACRKMSEDYGSDVIHFQMPGTHLIFVNSFEAATELMDKRSSIYSDRPSTGMTMVRDLLGLKWSLALQPYGPEWRDGRKAFQHEFRPHVASKFHPIELKATHLLLRSLLHAPEHFAAHIRHLAGRVIMDVAYGIEVQDRDDYWINTAEHAMEGGIKAGVPGTFLVDLIPILQYIPAWFPGAKFKRIAQVYHKSVMAMLNEPFDLVRGKLAAGESVPDSAAKSLIENMIEKSEDPAYTERVVRYALGSMYSAGSDTTVAVLTSFVLAMVLYPNVQNKAQEYIDRVCQNRLPDFSDYDALPYTHAVIKEALRWCPAFPINIPHKLMQDDIYNGYFIPAGSMILSNNWAILHDPIAYPDPETFNPERFLITDDDGTLVLNPDVRDPEDIAFGFGRRMCPGRYMAYDSMWIAVVSVLAAFKIEKAKDERGEPVTPTVEMGGGTIAHLKPFPCQITARSPTYEELITSSH